METLTALNDGATTQESAQYLAFTLGSATYGFPVKSVREVVEYPAIFKIPRVPDHIRGVVNLRGEVLPVIDLAFLFYGKRGAVTASTGIVFVEVNHLDEAVVLGVMIDSVEAVADIFEDDIDESPVFGQNINPEFISAIGRVDGRFIILLDVDNVLNIQSLSMLGQDRSGKGGV
jgi:purine-binding chemotaxis protein CheW